MDTTPHRLRNTLLSFTMATVMAFGVVAGLGGTADAQVSTRYDASVDATLADIQAYWTATMPDVYGRQYQAIPTDRVYAYGADNPPPNCDDGGRTRAPYDQVAGNAFYCSNGDFVAYDEQGLLPKLRSNFGEFAVGLVFAHELGHAVQARVGFQPPAAVDFEQQADCFAGSWAQHVASSNDETVHLSKDDLDHALAGLLTLSDPSGIDSSQDGAHGNGFDRVGAFQDGYEAGAQACADYQDNPPAVTEAGYASYEDQASGGNLALGDMLPTVTKSLQRYWAGQVSGAKGTTAPTVVASSDAPACDGNTDRGVLDDTVTYCPSTNTIAYDPATLRQAHDSIGDFASAVLVATAWSSSVQHQLGNPVGTTTARTGAECLAGAWAADRATSLSPGDLDEAVTLLVTGSVPERQTGSVPERQTGSVPERQTGSVPERQTGNHDSADRGSAFDRVAAFRAGYKHGPSKCVPSS